MQKMSLILVKQDSKNSGIIKDTSTGIEYYVNSDKKTVECNHSFFLNDLTASMNDCIVTAAKLLFAANKTV